MWWFCWIPLSICFLLSRLFFHVMILIDAILASFSQLICLSIISITLTLQHLSIYCISHCRIQKGNLRVSFLQLICLSSQLICLSITGITLTLQHVSIFRINHCRIQKGNLRDTHIRMVSQKSGTSFTPKSERRATGGVSKFAYISDVVFGS
jgi:hypothetical protein